MKSYSFVLVLTLGAGVAHAGSAFVSQSGGSLNPVTDTGTMALPYQLGSLGPLFSSVFVTLINSGSFSEYATFTIPAAYGNANGASNTYALSVQLPSGPLVVGSITDFTVTVADGTPGAPGLYQSGPYSAGVTFALPPNATADDYFLRFTGTVNGVGGQYSAAMQASLVPEPISALMMLLGLGALAVRVRRQRG